MGKLEIWGTTIPGNSKKSKLDDMEIKKHALRVPTMIAFMKALTVQTYCDKKKEIDTFTWISEIKNGKMKETYEDVPTLDAFPVKESKQAVIVVPGGGYSFLSSDADEVGKQGEGDAVAQALNKAGISAFVLRYRLNPYRQPIPLLDLQRAVRYVRYHAAEYGIDKTKIGAIGFSAGGYQVAGMLGIAEGKKLLPADYEPDEVDAESDELNFAALLYPALSYKHNRAMMFASFAAEQVRDEAVRERLMEDYNCLEHMTDRDIPYFFCWGTNDHMVNIGQIETYIEILQKQGRSVETVPVKGADHGYGANVKEMENPEYWVHRFTDWCRQR